MQFVSRTPMRRGLRAIPLLTTSVTRALTAADLSTPAAAAQDTTWFANAGSGASTPVPPPSGRPDIIVNGVSVAITANATLPPASAQE